MLCSVQGGYPRGFREQGHEPSWEALYREDYQSDAAEGYVRDIFGKNTNRELIKLISDNFISHMVSKLIKQRIERLIFG